MNKTFKALIESVNAQIQVLNSNGHKIYDTENPEYFISGIKYDSEEDAIKFECEEDPSKSYSFRK